MQTAYDVFLIAPIGIGVADQSAGGSLVLGYFTGREIKNCLEFLLPGDPTCRDNTFHACPACVSATTCLDRNMTR